MDKSIAIILPVYQKDRPLWLRLAIDSILSQSYPWIQLYIGVDGPVGSELEEVLYCYENARHVCVIHFEFNRGLACVLNDLLDICFKEGYVFIARMDADDISSHERLEKQMRFLSTHPEVDVVGGGIREIDEFGQDRGKIIIYPETPRECYQFFGKRNPHAHPAVLFRKSYFDKAKCKYRPEYRQNQDTMLWFDGMMAGTVHANIPEVVLNFRVTDSMFKKRRNGWRFAKKQLHDRMIINKGLRYGFSSYLFAYAMFCLLVSPVWIKKIAYKVFR